MRRIWSLLLMLALAGPLAVAPVAPGLANDQDEARRLMLTEGLEAATASYRVGYESPSHFSREYSRMFGAPPKADVTLLRGEWETAESV